MSLRLTAVSILALGAAWPAVAEPVFNRIASFPVAANLPAGVDALTETSAEIMAVTGDGNMLVYSDSPNHAIGMIDITDPKAPKAAGAVPMEGEPTTTVILGGRAYVGVNTSESFTDPSGSLRVVDLESREIIESCELGGQPDAVAASPDGSRIAVAIENERDEELNDGALPQEPAGYVVILPVTDGALDCAGQTKIEMTGLAEIGGSDPEPEFLAFNNAGALVVTMQENNHLAVIGPDGKITSHFSAGTVDLKDIDTEKDGKLDFTGALDGVPREPDAVAWLDNDHFITANEGDYKGGSRGFTVWNTSGEVIFESGTAFEHVVAAAGHYPDKRSGKKGAEPEAVIVGEFGDRKLAFVASERGSLIGVYDMADPAAPQLTQILPTGIGPEGLVAIPQRNLLAVANEVDLGAENGARSYVMLYELAEGEAAYPAIRSSADKLIGWGALSGLALSPGEETQLFAVSDSFYSAAPSIFRIDASSQPATITEQIVVTRDGTPAEKLDLEGITSDGQDGFWLASEGNPEKEVPAAILHVDATGAITQEFGLPEALAAQEKRFGFEGIALIDGKLWVAVQREWGDDPEGQAKLLRLDPETEEWAAVRYPLDKGAGWVGLSELAVHGDHLYLIERDNQIGENAALKQITRVKLADLAPAPLDADIPLVEKEVVRDLIPDLKSFGGYVLDKVEGMAITPDGSAYLVTDNDGVDDSSGETLFWSVKLDQ